MVIRIQCRPAGTEAKVADQQTQSQTFPNASKRPSSYILSFQFIPTACATFFAMATSLLASFSRARGKLREVSWVPTNITLSAVDTELVMSSTDRIGWLDTGHRKPRGSFAANW